MTSPIEKLSEHLRDFSLKQTMGIGRDSDSALENAFRSSSAELLEYSVCGRDGEEVALVREVGERGPGLFFSKSYFGFMRDFKFHVLDTDDKLIISINKPSHFLQYKAVVSDSKGRTMGTIEKVFNPFIRSFQLRCRNSRLKLSIRAPIIRPWTFPVYSRKKEVAKIMKKVSSVGQFMTRRETLKVKSYLSSSRRALFGFGGSGTHIRRLF